MIDIKSKNSIYLLIFVLLYAVLNLTTLYHGHNWGDDFSYYLAISRNIANGQPLLSGIILNQLHVPPPGFSIILLPFVYIFGLNFAVLKIINVIFWALSIITIYPIFKKEFGEDIAGLCTILLLASNYFFTFKQQILSDVPYVFFIALAIRFFLEICESEKNNDPAASEKYFKKFLLIAAIAFFIKTAALFLFASAILYFVFVYKNWGRAFRVFAVLIAGLALQSLIIGIHSGKFQYFFASPVEHIITIYNNSFLVLSSILYFYCPAVTRINAALFKSLVQLIILIYPFVYVLLGVYLISGLLKRKISFIACFTIINILALTIITAFPVSPKTFARHIMAIAPWVLLLSIKIVLYLMKAYCSKFSRTLNVDIIAKVGIAIFIILNIYANHATYYFNDDAILNKKNSELFSWVKENISTSEHYFFYKPRAMALLTNRLGYDITWIKDPAEFHSIMKNYAINYIILRKSREEYIYGFQRRYPNASLKWENDVYMIFYIDL
ncbi:MAG: glycosyltransferase family 39 protein [Candidatus Omnitrophica bacterium]|nr:glycosyltransferase family 39 protein [Candidatus Omnitrophota bacterium]